MRGRAFILILGNILILVSMSIAQQKLTGIVMNKLNNEPIKSATVTSAWNKVEARTDKAGRFELTLTNDKDTIVVNHLNYAQTKIFWEKSQSGSVRIFLSPIDKEIEQVEIYSGYSEVSKEKAVGSFSSIGKDVLERTTSSNILERLDGVANGLSLNRANSTYREAQNQPQIRVRGINTIYSSASPLIIVDNFPYEGNIEDINPNDVESVTLLKDAAASSIWGTRAGNGVIVITTKKGRGKQKIEFTSNLQLIRKPDLEKDRTFLNASTIMEIEKMRFDANGYAQHNLVPLPDYVEILFKHREGLITDEQLDEMSNQLRSTDLRKDASEYLYRNSTEQQYFLNISGAHDRHNYYISGGLNKGLSRVVGNDSRRATLDFKNTFRLSERVSFSTGLNYTENIAKNNGLTVSNLGPSQFRISPYTRLTDDLGNAMGTPINYRTRYTDAALENGLLDWTYRPLDEIALSDKKSTDRRIRLNIGVEATPFQNLKLTALYQNQYGTTKDEQYRPKESYYVRDLVNKFTQADGDQIIPYGGILNGGLIERKYQYGRIQADYKKEWQDHNISTFAGAEIRQEILRTDPDYLLYNYDNNRTVGQTMFDYTTYYPIRPEGTALVPSVPNTTSYLLDRFLSYYGNLAYGYRQRYLVNFSARWDGANIFGVRTNQKGTPLWSAGLAWNIDKESFFRTDDFSAIKLRATYGYSGNVNKNISSVPMIYYTNDSNTGLTRSILRSTGNPDLRWEKVSTINLGLDISSKNNRIRGSLDYYVKHANDLIGYSVLDPTTGIFSAGGSFEIDNRTNYANMLTRGIDFELVASIINHRSITWNANLIFNHNSNKITKYMDLESPLSDLYFPPNVAAPPLEGKSIDVIYALPWNGLDPETGNPIVYLDGELSQSYSAYYSQLTLGDMIDMGVTVPRFTTSVRNNVGYKNLSVSFMITFKGGHKFRRSSINYSSLYNSGNGHIDYYGRWQKPGDELVTNIPSMPAITALNPQRERIYAYSQVLIERADHLRLQDINISYDIPSLRNRNGNLRLFCLMSNVGIIWRANKHNIDPDYHLSSYPPRRTFSLGAKLDL